MSHEIRTPMNGLLVMAELLERSNLPPSEARHAGTIARSGRSLMHLLNDIMDFSKLEAGKIDLEAIPLSPDEIVGDCVGLFWEQARSKDIEIVPYIAPNVPAQLIGDPTRIGQCLSNLVGNAIKFTEEGHVGITITREDDGTLVIAVSDTGMGIPEDRLALDLRSLFASRPIHHPTPRGTGLGLSICVQLTEAMGGEIDVTSTPGEGSCFTLRLPLDSAQDNISTTTLPSCITVETTQPALKNALERALMARGIATEGAAQARFIDTDSAAATASDIPQIGLWRLDADMPEHAIGQGWLDDLLRIPFQRRDLDALLDRIATSKLRGLDLLREHAASRSQTTVNGLSALRVLIADDSAVNREVMSETLEVYGIVPTLACDGAEALARLADTELDIAFIDGEMPHHDGFEVARRTRAAGTNTRLVLFSAHAEKSLAKNALENGFDDSLPKPFPLDALKALLLSVAGIEDTTPAPAPAPTDTPTEESSEDAIFDQASLASLRALDSRRPGAMQRVLDRFMATLPDAEARLVTALEGGDSETIRQAAHAMKSMCLSVGAAQLSQTVATIERNAAGEIDLPVEWENNTKIITKKIHEEATSLKYAIQSIEFEVDDKNTSNVL